MLGLAGTVMWMFYKQVGNQMSSKQGEKLIEVEQCTRDYFDNKCPLDERLPALEDYCTQKEICMQRNPFPVLFLFL